MTETDPDDQAISLAKEMIRRFEGLSLKPYPCPAGKWTIGYGNTMLADGTPVTEKTLPITQDQAEDLLDHTVRIFKKYVDRDVTVPLSPQQRAALVDFTYNAGEENLQHSTLLKKLNAGDYEGAASEFGKWVHAGKNVLPGLVTRRHYEEKIFREGM